MSIVGTGNFSGYTGTWFPSQNINKDLYQRTAYPTYDYLKFRLFGATAMIFYNTSVSNQMIYWTPQNNPAIPCFGIGIWQFKRTFSQYPLYPVETNIGAYRSSVPEYFCGVVNTFGSLGWIPQGTFTESFGSVSITYNY